MPKIPRAVSSDRKEASTNKPKNTEVPLYYVGGKLVETQPVMEGAADCPEVKISQVEASIEQWLKEKLKASKKSHQDQKIETSSLWGENLSLHIRNLGRVIGKQLSLPGTEKSVRYRIDWDETKGAHFNIEMLPPLVGKYVFIFDDQTQIKLESFALNKRLKDLYTRVSPKSDIELGVIQYSRQLTQEALAGGDSMPELIAESILRHLPMCLTRSDVATHCEELGSLVPVLSTVAQKVLEKQKLRLELEAKQAIEDEKRREDAALKQEAQRRAEQEEIVRRFKLEEDARRQAAIERKEAALKRQVEIDDSPAASVQRPNPCSMMLSGLFNFFLCRKVTADSKGVEKPSIKASKRYKYGR